MAPPLSYSKFLAALRAEGLTVIEEKTDGKSPQYHNRNHKGPWGPVNGVMIHHTVTKGHDHTVNICRTGYSTLPGPLCHGVICKQGHIHVVGYGRTNHAGMGDDDVLDAVVAEKPVPDDNEANTDGNRHFYGFECENLGDGEDPWPAVQVEAIVRASAALCRAHGWNVQGAGEESVIGHKEWQPGKVDPRGIAGDMDGIRDRVDARLRHAASWSPGDKPEAPSNNTPEEDEVQLNDKVAVGDWVKQSWPDDAGIQDGSISVNTALGSGYAHSRRAAENTVAILAQLKAQQETIDKLVDAVSKGVDVNLDELKVEIREAIESVKVEFKVVEAQ